MKLFFLANSFVVFGEISNVRTICFNLFMLFFCLLALFYASVIFLMGPHELE